MFAKTVYGDEVHHNERIFMQALQKQKLRCTTSSVLAAVYGSEHYTSTLHLALSHARWLGKGDYLRFHSIHVRIDFLVVLPSTVELRVLLVHCVWL